MKKLFVLSILFFVNIYCAESNIDLVIYEEDVPNLLAIAEERANLETSHLKQAKFHLAQKDHQLKLATASPREAQKFTNLANQENLKALALFSVLSDSKNPDIKKEARHNEAEIIDAGALSDFPSSFKKAYDYYKELSMSQDQQQANFAKAKLKKEQYKIFHEND